MKNPKYISLKSTYFHNEKTNYIQFSKKTKWILLEIFIMKNAKKYFMRNFRIF